MDIKEKIADIKKTEFKWNVAEVEIGRAHV